jgi:hypothetical protein
MREKRPSRVCATRLEVENASARAIGHSILGPEDQCPSSGTTDLFAHVKPPQRRARFHRTRHVPPELAGMAGVRAHVVSRTAA